MKKTIALLLTAAGMAVAANDITDNITWTSDTTATIATLSGDMSIAFLLNWDEINTDKKQTLFTAYGPGSITESEMYGVGMGIFYSATEGYDLNSIHVNNSTVNYTNGYTNITEVLKQKEYTSITSAVLVYTFDKTQSNTMNGTFGGTLYLWLDSEETPLSIYAGYQRDTYVGSLTNLVFDENRVDTQSVRFYDGLIEDSAEFAKTIRNGSIPEPSTATLSLLALAGLAARRRRK